jgi:hypothetical protein
MRTLSVLISIISMLLTACGYTDETYNKDIPDTNSAKTLIDVADEAVNEYWEGKEYHVGEVYMKVNQHHEGKVMISYAEKSLNSSPHVIEVIFDTESDKLVEIVYLGNDSKVDPGKVLIKEWKIDSDKAMEVAMGKYGDEVENFDSIILLTNNVRNYWVVRLFKNNIRYFVEVDPYSGEVISHGKQKIKN